MGTESAMRWQDLATALACSVRAQLATSSQPAIDEAFVHRAAGEYIERAWKYDVDVEVPYYGRRMRSKKLDLVAYSRRASGDRRRSGDSDSSPWKVAIELKFVRTDRGSVSWLREVVEDAFRLLQIEGKDVSQYCERAVVVVGLRKDIESELWSRRLNGGGRGGKETAGRFVGIDNLLPTRHAVEPMQVRVRSELRDPLGVWLKSLGRELGSGIPSSYMATLCGHFVAGTDPCTHRGPLSMDRHPEMDAVEAIVWHVKRPKNFNSFNPVKEWGAGKKTVARKA